MSTLHSWTNNIIQRVGFKFSGGGENLERRNVELPVFRNFEIANIKIKNNELFDNFIFDFFFIF